MLMIQEVPGAPCMNVRSFNRSGRPRPKNDDSPVCVQHETTNTETLERIKRISFYGGLLRTNLLPPPHWRRRTMLVIEEVLGARCMNVQSFNCSGRPRPRNDDSPVCVTSAQRVDAVSQGKAFTNVGSNRCAGCHRTAVTGTVEHTTRIR